MAKTVSTLFQIVTLFLYHVCVLHIVLRIIFLRNQMYLIRKQWKQYTIFDTQIRLIDKNEVCIIKFI